MIVEFKYVKNNGFTVLPKEITRIMKVASTLVLQHFKTLLL